MTTEAKPSAMRRKAGAGRPPPEIGRLTAAKAVRSAVVQAAEDVAGLSATAGVVEERRTTLEPFIESLPDAALLALIEGPGARFGTMVLDAQVVAALIEIQTTGRVVPRPAEPRAPTRTDAIMCADFVDRLLDLIDARASEAELEEAPALAGFRYGLALAEPRAIAMTLENTHYRAFRFEVDLGRSAKSGAMQILLPFDPPGVQRSGSAEAKAFAEAMRAQVLETQAVLSATLLRRRISLAEVAGFEVGTLVTVPRDALTAIRVEALDGTVVAHGRLGQANGHRAVRLTLAEGEAVAPPPAPAIGALKPTVKALPPDMPASQIPVGAPPDMSPGGSSDPAPDLGDLGNLGGGEPGDIGDLGGLGELGGLGNPGDFGA